MVDIKVPPVGESINSVILASWLVNDGDYVELDQMLCELESDKATFEVPSEKAGVIKIVASVDDELAIGALLCTIDETAAPPAGGSAPAKAETAEEAPAAKVEAPTAAPAASGSNYATGTPSPAAAKILAEKGIDASTVKGTGKDGRITKADAQAATASPKKSSASVSVSADSGASSAFSRETRTERMSSLRKTIAKHLVNSKNGTAMLTTFNEVDLTAVKEIRAKYKEPFKEKHEIGLGFMSFFMKAAAMALMEQPAVNAQIEGNHIKYHDFVDISIAVSTPKGLVVPVVKNVESLSMKDVEKKVKELALKGRENKLTLEEMTGGTFTVTNGGVFGSLQSTPIINAPQSAILGMHKIQNRPMAINGEVVIKPMMYLAVSYDHRIIDGKEAVTFLVRVKELLEDPIRLLINV